MTYWIAGYLVGAIVTYVVTASWSRRSQEAPGMAIIYGLTWPLFLVILGCIYTYTALEQIAITVGIPLRVLDRFVWFCLGAGSSGVIALLVD